MSNESCDCCETIGYNKCTGKTEAAPCPYRDEIKGDLTPCNCCEERQSECRSDI